MDRIFVFLSNPLDSDIHRVSWHYVTDKRVAKKPDSYIAPEFSRGSASLDEFSDLYHKNFPDAEVVFIISGQYLTYTNVVLAVKNQKQMLQALPFLVEEQIVGNIEDMHIAAPERLSGDSVRVAIIEKSTLDRLKAIFAEHKLSVSTIYGLPDLLNCHESELQILLNDDFAIVKSLNTCFQCDQINLETILELVSWDTISTIHISLHELNKYSLSIAKRIKSKFGSDILTVKSSIFTEDMLDYIIRVGQGDANHSLNILQGDVSSASNRNQKLQQFIPLAWVALLCLCLQISFNIASGFYFKKLSNLTYQDASALYLKLFPEEKKIVDLASQLNIKTSSLGEGPNASKFPTVFATTIHAMYAVGSQNDIKVKQFRYDETNGELKVGLDATSIALLDKIKNKLAEDKLSVEIISANEDNGVIKATLSIKYT